MSGKQAVLLVEGRDDLFVCQEVFAANAVPKCCEVKEHQGVDALLRAFPLYLENTAYGRVGLIVDADEDVSARWEAIRRHLTGFGYERVPPHPEPDGTVVAAPEEDRPLAGVWIMPDNKGAGILEDFIRSLVPAGDPLLTYAENCVDGITAGARRFPDVRRSKAVVHTWLAWQEEPGTPLGLAIKSRYLDATLGQGQRLAEWCRRLFVEETSLLDG